MLEDTATLIGLTAAFIGVYLAHRFGNPYFELAIQRYHPSIKRIFIEVAPTTQ